MKTMKYLLPLFMATFMCGCTSSADEPVVEPEKKKEVTLIIDFKCEGESMSRSNADVYSKFYDTRIKTRDLIPDDYTLYFKNKKTGADYSFKGKWSSNDMITILEGEYTVTGTCYDSETNYFQQKVSLKFEEDVKIEGSDTKLVLNAIYDSFLVFFNKSNISSLQYCSNTESQYMIDIKYEFEDHFYIFSRSLKSSYKLFIQGKRTNGSLFKVYTYNVPFENGKYYFFNDATSSFEIPKMEAGN